MSMAKAFVKGPFTITFIATNDAFMQFISAMLVSISPLIFLILEIEIHLQKNRLIPLLSINFIENAKQSRCHILIS